LRYSYCSNRQAIPTTGLGAISQHGLGIWLNTIHSLTSWQHQTWSLALPSIEKNKPLEEGSIVYFQTVFTIEDSLLYILEVFSVQSELFTLWSRQGHTFSTSSLVCVPRGNKHPNLVKFFECVRECGGIKQGSLHWIGPRHSVC
jgi:hypothetical protein